jgi:hypothetical protein
MIKTMTKCFAAFAVVALAVACIAFAAPSQAFAYEYQVRVFGGNEGTYGEGSNPYVISVNPDGSLVESLSINNVKVNSDKYYAKGFRIAGQDDLWTPGSNINEDMDVVVAYGIKGEQVSVTVSYVERGTGRALTGSDSGQTSVTYYGKKGDRLIAPYEHIPGYRPLYRNVAGTLGDEGSNNWTLEYVPLAAGETESGATTGTTAATPTTTTPSATTTAPSTTATTPSTTGTTGTGTDTGNDNATGTTPATPTTPTTPTTTPATPVEPPATQELLDEDNPLASAIDTEGGDTSATPTEGTEGGKGIPIAAIFAIAAVLVALVGALIYLFRRRNGAAELADAAAEGEASSNGPGDTMN